VPHGDGELGRAVVDYIRRITADEGFRTEFAWEGDEVRIHAAEQRGDTA